MLTTFLFCEWVWERQRDTERDKVSEKKGKYSKTFLLGKKMLNTI